MPTGGEGEEYEDQEEEPQAEEGGTHLLHTSTHCLHRGAERLLHGEAAGVQQQAYNGEGGYLAHQQVPHEEQEEDYRAHEVDEEEDEDGYQAHEEGSCEPCPSSPPPLDVHGVRLAVEAAVREFKRVYSSLEALEARQALEQYSMPKTKGRRSGYVGQGCSPAGQRG